MTQTILLTGASGFLAAHIGKQLLQRGFTVRGTVRSEEKGKYLDNLYKDKNWSWVIVKDIETANAFDSAVQGVDAVIHTASPFHFNVVDPYKDLINPAVAGTTILLESAVKEPKIKRVVITSSFAAIANDEKPPYVYTEKDWNTVSAKEVEKTGDKFHAYRASKTLAEKTAWDFLENRKKNDGKAPFDIATINPPYILGPIIHQCSGPDALNTSMIDWYQYLTGKRDDSDGPAMRGSFVDVRDAAQAHIDAVVTEAASNQRFVINNDILIYQKFLDFAHSKPGLLDAFPNAQKGVPGEPDPVSSHTSLSAEKAKATFNWTPIDWRKTVEDMTLSLAERQKEWTS